MDSDSESVDSQAEFLNYIESGNVVDESTPNASGDEEGDEQEEESDSSRSSSSEEGQIETEADDCDGASLQDEAAKKDAMVAVVALDLKEVNDSEVQTDTTLAKRVNALSVGKRDICQRTARRRKLSACCARRITIQLSVRYQMSVSRVFDWAISKIMRKKKETHNIKTYKQNCPNLWRTYKLKASTKRKRGDAAPELIYACYNCASSSHFGDQCPHKSSAYGVPCTAFTILNIPREYLPRAKEVDRRSSRGGSSSRRDDYYESPSSRSRRDSGRWKHDGYLESWAARNRR
ncbi:hypothetical protein BJ741DRAFT_583512 [Chytriomyces cf. hyalinus JEL632]|nr:hypothetical protein BJ741DRAFT_583512 [Chytriomyces cf. hyalinus JEL632]